MQNRGASVSAVIAGLDPAIHLFRKNFDAKKMDLRVKPAGDAAGRGSTGLIRPGHALARFPNGCSWRAAVSSVQKNTSYGSSIKYARICGSSVRAGARSRVL
jgi:hypothetical protein